MKYRRHRAHHAVRSLRSPKKLLPRCAGTDDPVPGVLEQSPRLTAETTPTSGASGIRGIRYAVYGLPLAVLLLVGFFRRLPPQRQEAAAIDGAGEWRQFFLIGLVHDFFIPMSALPVLVIYIKG